MLSSYVFFIALFWSGAIVPCGAIKLKRLRAGVLLPKQNLSRFVMWWNVPFGCHPAVEIVAIFFKTISSAVWVIQTSGKISRKHVCRLEKVKKKWNRNRIAPLKQSRILSDRLLAFLFSMKTAAREAILERDPFKSSVFSRSRRWERKTIVENIELETFIGKVTKKLNTKNSLKWLSAGM